MRGGGVCGWAAGAALGAVALLATSGTAVGAAKWSTYTDCSLVTSEYHDGDSFHVKRGRRTEIFRLYFVDAPETDTTLEDRLREQAEHFGTTTERMLEVGEDAKVFAMDFLDSTFTVESLREDARGSSKKPRYYAMVRVDDADLGLALVEAGLARVYGVMRELPDGTPAEKHRAKLRAAERRAEREQRGAWSREGRGPGSRLGPARLVTPSPAPLTPHNLVLVKPLAIYSIAETGRVGVLKAGTEVRVLGVEGSGYARIRFRIGEKTYEAKCRRAELGV